MKTKSKLLIAAAVIPGFLVVSGLIGGCSSSILAPELSPAEKIIVESASFDYVVGIEEYNPKIYSDRLIESLRKTNLFKEVNYIERLSSEPTLTGRVNRAVYGSSVIPMVTALTLGFFPTWVEEEHGNSFTLTRTDKPTNTVKVNSVYKGNTVLGWVSGILNIFPNRTNEDSKSHPRYYKRLAYDVITALN